MDLFHDERVSSERSLTGTVCEYRQHIKANPFLRESISEHPPVKFKFGRLQRKSIGESPSSGVATNDEGREGRPVGTRRIRIDARFLQSASRVDSKFQFQQRAVGHSRQRGGRAETDRSREINTDLISSPRTCRYRLLLFLARSAAMRGGKRSIDRSRRD